MYYGAIDCTSLSSVHLLDGDSVASNLYVNMQKLNFY